MNNNIPALTKPRYWIRSHLDIEKNSMLHAFTLYSMDDVMERLDRITPTSKRKFTIFQEDKGVIRQQKTWLSQAWLCLDAWDKIQAAQDLELLT